MSSHHKVYRIHTQHFSHAFDSLTSSSLRWTINTAVAKWQSVGQMKHLNLGSDVHYLSSLSKDILHITICQWVNVLKDIWRYACNLENTLKWEYMYERVCLVENICMLMRKNATYFPKYYYWLVSLFIPLQPPCLKPLEESIQYIE